MSQQWEERRRAWKDRRHADANRERDIAYAANDAGTLAEEASRLLARAEGSSWYEDPGSAVDEATAALCRLRRAQSGSVRSMEGGDEAVRRVLERADRKALVWLASRTISYMDENGFPELVEPWLPPRQSLD
jgi:hypothetical protein